LENESAIDQLGGEDVGLAKAIEESVRDHTKNAMGSSQSSGGAPLNPMDESKVQKLVNMGFPRDQVVSELTRFNGDETQAIAALFAKSFKF